eukprot:SAG31_NODE_36960_length_308_cov_2.421053_1_plen_38_part_01
MSRREPKLRKKRWRSAVWRGRSRRNLGGALCGRYDKHV